MDSTQQLDEHEGGDDDDSEGRVYIWQGYQQVSPERLRFPCAVVQASIGQQHAGFVTESGQLWMYGENSDGQLGIGQTVERQDKPVLVSSLQGIIISSVSCGFYHTVAVSHDGAVYCWGDNTHGQCGTDQHDKLHEPTTIPLRDASPPCRHGNKRGRSSVSDTDEEDRSKYVRILQCGAGEHHTLVLSDYGELWVWGSGPGLGLNQPTGRAPPTKIEYLLGRHALNITCGAKHNLAIMQKLSRPIHTNRHRSASIESTKSTSTCSSKDSVAIPSSSQANMNRYRPATCAKCKEEIYGLDDLIESCDPPKCPLGLSVKEPPVVTPALGHRPASASNLVSLDNTTTPNVQPVPNQEPQAPASSAELTTTEKPQESEPSKEASVPKKDADSIPVSEKEDAKISDTAKETETVDSEQNGVGEEEEVMTTSTGSLRIGGVTKSRSSFLQDEEEAKVFLEKQLYGEQKPPAVTRVNSSTTPPISPLVKTVGSFLSYVPTEQAAAMQEYVTCVTKTVVSNIKTSVGKSIDKIGSIYSSTDEEKSTVPGSPDLLTPSLEDMAKLQDNREFSRYGTLPKSTSMGGLKMRGGGGSSSKYSHARKGSLPSGAIDLEINHDSCGGCAEIVLDTEVWSWGRGNHGQLGHGDMLDRLQPCPIKMFRDAKVTRVVAADNHSLVIMASSHVYVWGQSDNGKLGHSESSVASPFCLKVLGSAPVWDIAGGADHTILLADAMPPQVFYTGKQYKSESSTSMLAKVDNINKVHGGCIHSIVAGGSMCACIISTRHVLHEFAASERTFHTVLDHVARKVIKPLLASESFRAIESSPVGMTLHMLCRAFTHLTDSAAHNHLELVQVLRRRRSLQQLRLVAKADKTVAAFQHYIKCLSDVVSMGALDYCVRAASAFWDKAKDHVQQAATNAQLINMDILKLDDKLLTSTLGVLFYLPYNRVAEYHKWLDALALKSSPYGSEHHMLSQVASGWQGLKTKATAQMSLATATRSFWDTVTPKIIDQLRVPRRRLLRTSKKHPLSLHGAGRFSSHTFLLFSDMFVHQQYSTVQQYFLQTIWVEALPDAAAYSNAIKLIMPEDSLILTAPTGSEKAEWLYEMNKAIGNHLNEEKHGRSRSQYGGLLSPPRDRHASHMFSTRNLATKEAKYSGMWRLGSMHGHGELSWPDGKRYIGKFKDGFQQGYGLLTFPCKDDELSGEEQEGYWEQNKLHGLGTIRYANGSVYKGNFREGKRHGHGVHKQGKITSSTASIYIGEWSNDKRNGYGVLDDIAKELETAKRIYGGDSSVRGDGGGRGCEVRTDATYTIPEHKACKNCWHSKGEKYMGYWQDDQRHGNGVIVTLLGMYFEGSFMQNKMTGYGLLMTEDHSCYEGEFSGGPNLSGKGTLTLPNGDYIEGHFNGSFTDGIKVNGTFYKAAASSSADTTIDKKTTEHAVTNLPKSFGRLSVPAVRKWEELFDMCCVTLGCSEKNEVNTARAWEKVASMVAMGQKHSADENSDVSAVDYKVNLAIKAWEQVALLIANGRENALDESLPQQERFRATGIPDDLEKIPNFTVGKLSTQHYDDIRHYLTKAVDTAFHPLGRLMEGLVDVYWATYVGVGAQPRLLHHAVKEVKAFVDRLYPIIRILFPDLPDNANPVLIFPEDYDDNANQEDEVDHSETVTPASLLHPLLLPKIYPPLFTLYALFNEKEDEKYWRRVCHWNKQPDLALMSYLGVKQKFWLIEDMEEVADAGQRLSSVKDKCYMDAIETLQRISTLFSPTEKLELIHNTFTAITKVVQGESAAYHLWCMDDLLPVFQYVVVRARIQHLGAEIHFIDDLMEEHLQFGELCIMFTTLKACYYQIQNEKLT